MRSSLRLAPLILLGGCFVYSQAETRNTPAGKLIEVTLTQQGASRLEPEVGRFAHIIAGQLLADDRQAIEMRLARVHRTDGQSVKADGQTVRVPHELVVAVHERRVSKPRTWAMSLTSIAVLLWTSTKQ